MATGIITRPRTLVTPSIRRQSLNELSLDGVDSDDDEEGGTLLRESVAVATSLVDTNAKLPRHHGDQPNTHNQGTQETPNNRLFISKRILNANGAIDWLLRRNTHKTPKKSTSRPKSRGSEQKRDLDDDNSGIRDIQDIPSIFTTPYDQAVDTIPFKDNLNLIYNDPVPQKWLVGKKYVLHETVDDHPENEQVPLIEAVRILQTLAPNFPIPKVHAGWKENGRVITISDVAPGERLYDIWWDLSPEEQENIAKQVASYIEDWRRTNFAQIASLTGGPVHHHKNLFGDTENSLGPFKSDLELWQAIAARLEGKGVDDATIEFLREHMPASSPCVFTHGDLSSTNITVHNGAVTAIAGIENASYLPTWAEAVAMHFARGPEDEQWKALLHTHMGHRYPAALDWWALWTAVEDGVSDGVRLARLRARCERWGKTEVQGQAFSAVSESARGQPSEEIPAGFERGVH
ncbi:kinase-like domain-containing protein [Xylaria arbuscula]|nr:kinase-like domain-containing protein [Xylaria arbuscula]